MRSVSAPLPFYTVHCLASYDLFLQRDFTTSSFCSGQLYVIMEYCENGNLKDFLSKNSAGFLDEVETVAEPLSPDGYLAPTRNAPREVQLYKVCFEDFYVFFFLFLNCSELLGVHK